MVVTQKVKKELKSLDTRYLCYGVGGMGKKYVVKCKDNKQHREQVKGTKKTHGELSWNTMTRFKQSKNY